MIGIGHHLILGVESWGITHQGYMGRHYSWVRQYPHDSRIKRETGTISPELEYMRSQFDGGSETNSDKVYDGVPVLNILVDVYRERVAHHGLKEEI